MGVWKLGGKALSGFEGSNDGRATFRLNADHLWPLRSDPAHTLHLIECLPHSHQASATSRRVDDDVRQRPFHPFRKLVPHRLLSFRSVGFFERAQVEPAFTHLSL